MASITECCLIVVLLQTEWVLVSSFSSGAPRESCGNPSAVYENHLTEPNTDLNQLYTVEFTPNSFSVTSPPQIISVRLRALESGFTGFFLEPDSGNLSVSSDSVDISLVRPVDCQQAVAYSQSSNVTKRIINLIWTPDSTVTADIVTFRITWVIDILTIADAVYRLRRTTEADSCLLNHELYFEDSVQVNSSADRINVGESVTFRCLDGTAATRSVQDRICYQGGLLCEPVTNPGCPVLLSPPNIFPNNLQTVPSNASLVMSSLSRSFSLGTYTVNLTTSCENDFDSIVLESSVNYTQTVQCQGGEISAPFQCIDIICFIPLDYVIPSARVQFELDPQAPVADGSTYHVGIWADQTISFQCVEGYIDMARRDGQTRRCTDPSVIAPSLNCTRIMCGLPSAAGHVANINTPAAMYGEVVSFTCAPGYRMFGDFPTPYIHTCFNPGQWDNLTFCAEIFSCFDQPCLNSGTCIQLDSNYICLCQPGFTDLQCQTVVEDGCADQPCAGGATCQSLPGGGFDCLCPPDSTGLTCESDTSCDIIYGDFEEFAARRKKRQAPEQNPFIVSNVTGPVPYLSVVNFTCAEGYFDIDFPNGERQRCDIPGGFITPQIQCAAAPSCNIVYTDEPVRRRKRQAAVNDNSMILSNVTGAVPYLSAVRFTCAPGYFDGDFPNGDVHICDIPGGFVRPQIQCTDSSCAVILIGSTNIVTNITGDTVPFLSGVNFTCPKGSFSDALPLGEVRTCDQKGGVIEPSIICTNITCVVGNTNSNLYVSVNDEPRFSNDEVITVQYQDRVSYMCYERQVEFATVICDRGNLQISNAGLFCEDFTCALPDLGGNVQASVSRGEVTNGQTVSFSCIQGYYNVLEHDGDPSNVTCTTPGTLSPKIQCQAIECPVQQSIFPVISNPSSIQRLGNGQAVYYTCGVGYEDVSNPEGKHFICNKPMNIKHGLNCIGSISVESLWPAFGPRAGGTNVTLRVQGLAYGDLLQVLIGDLPCTLHSQAPTIQQNIISVNCTTVEAPEDAVRVQSPVHLVVSSRDGPVATGFSFEYRPNPTVENVWPQTTIASGGTTITVTGTNLDASAVVLVRVDTVIYRTSTQQYQTLPSAYSTCDTPTFSLIFCSLPKLNIPAEFLPQTSEVSRRRRSVSANDIYDFVKEQFTKDMSLGSEASDKRKLRHKRQTDDGFLLKERIDQRDGFIEFYVEFVFDANMINATEIKVYIDMNVETWDEPLAFKPFWPSHDKFVEIKGDRFQNGVRDSDLHILLGDTDCEITSVLDNRIVCRPPESDDDLQKTGGNIDVLLSVGTGEYRAKVGEMYYPFNLILVIIIVVPIIALILIIIVVFICIKCCRNNKQSDKEGKEKLTKSGQAGTKPGQVGTKPGLPGTGPRMTSNLLTRTGTLAESPPWKAASTTPASYDGQYLTPPTSNNGQYLTPPPSYHTQYLQPSNTNSAVVRESVFA